MRPFIPCSLCYRVFDYRKNRQYKKWESELELEKLAIEKEGLKSTTKKTKELLAKIFKISEEEIDETPELQKLLKSFSKEEKVLQRITAEEKYHNRIINS